ncbi:MAG TPA: ABC transporter ATP-binding protein [Bacillota bacterium]|nr:ABC transporter ATP-binding protein [Bacillota bacterium]HQE01823.1 ABC transporter ATP-binding protein [Bacillota bacterium]
MKLVLENVNRIYEKGGDKTQALCDINVSFHAGEQVMIIGESGAGKSTLLNTIGLLDRGYTGLYSIDGKNAREYSAKEQAVLRNKMFGYIFQEYALLESESVYDNVRVPLLYSDVPRRKHREYIEESLEQVGLSRYIRKKVKYLSGGERQRVAIARALVNKPRVILADEPTGSLDSKNRQIILDIIYNYLDDTKILIFVTHDLENNRRGEQRILQLQQGRLSAC